MNLQIAIVQMGDSKGSKHQNLTQKSFNYPNAKWEQTRIQRTRQQNNTHEERECSYTRLCHTWWVQKWNTVMSNRNELSVQHEKHNKEKGKNQESHHSP